MPQFTKVTASYRANSEDRAAIWSLKTTHVVCVADGTGGMSGGAKAAELFVAAVQHAAAQANFDAADPVAWCALLEAIDAEIARDALAGETTGIAIAVGEELIVGASVGDSRAYLSVGGDQQELTCYQIRKPRLGTARAMPQSFSAKAEGILVVGTDGLFDYASLEAILGAASTASAVANGALVQLVLDGHRTLPDDIAAVVGWLD